jgi:hypothetical protein
MEWQTWHKFQRHTNQHCLRVVTDLLESGHRTFFYDELFLCYIRGYQHIVLAFSWSLLGTSTWNYQAYIGWEERTRKPRRALQCPFKGGTGTDTDIFTKEKCIKCANI